MADNVTVTTASGGTATIATDDIGGVQYRRSKLSLGADGTAVDAVAGAGAVGTGVQRVTLASDDPAVAVLEALQKAEDAAHSSGDKGVQALSVRKDTAAATSGTDGDYQPLITDANGRLHSVLASEKAEDAAHSSGDTGVAVLTKRTDTPAASAGTDGDYATLNTDAIGRVWVTDKHEVLSVTPTISAAVYAAGDAVGGKQTLTSAVLASGGLAVLDSLVVIDKANQKPVIDVVIFDSDPTAATITDNAAFVFSTDVSKVVQRIPVAAADYQTIDSIAIAVLSDLRKTVKASGSANLFAAVVLRSGTPTPVSTSDLIFKYGLAQK